MHPHLLTLLVHGSVAASLAVARPSSPCEKYIQRNSNLPNVTIFATGGTIASSGSTNTQTTNYQVGVDIEELVNAVPPLCNISNVSGMQVTNVDSSSMNTSILLDLSRRIAASLRDPSTHGAVITHGTDTLEETAFFLDLTIASPKPVVVTGSMRPSTALSADGPLNLYQAVKLAAGNDSSNRGVMVVLNDRIGSAYTTTKNNANSLDTFSATEQGQLGFFINQVPKFYSSPSTPRSKPQFNISNARYLPRVDILYGHQEANPYLIKASADSGAKGIVFAGVGAGGWNSDGLKVAQRVFNETGMPMVFSHRTTDGFAGGNEIYSFQLTSGSLNPQKARIMLQLALHAGYTQDQLRSLFEGQ